MTTTVEGVGDTLTWEDPPGTWNGKAERMGKYVDLLAPLLLNPEKWARVATYSKARAAYGKAGALVAGRYPLPPVTMGGAWEFVARTIREGEYGVFARFTRNQQAAK